MAKVGSASGTKLAGRADNAAGGSAGIEIVGFPQMLYTRTFGDPDTLICAVTGGGTRCKQDADTAHRAG